MCDSDPKRSASGRLSDGLLKPCSAVRSDGHKKGVSSGQGPATMGGVCFQI